MSKNTTKRKVGFVDAEMLDDEPKSLLRTLELQGNFRAHSQVQMELAYKHYVRESMAPKEIAKLVSVRADVIEKWVVLFGWDEDRAKHQLNEWRKVASVARRSGINVDERADRIMHTIEGAVEQLLQRHQDAVMGRADEGMLAAKDLATLAQCIKTTRGERKDVRGETKKNLQEHRVQVDIGGNVDILHRIGGMISDVTGINAQIESAREGHLLSDTDDVEDAEFEVLDDYEVSDG